MEISGTQLAINARTIPTGELRAAQAIYEKVSSKQQQSTGSKTENSESTTSDRVSISSRGQQLAKAKFSRDQQREAADFNRNEQQQEAAFNREQAQAKMDFQRQERQKEVEFTQNQRQDTREFKQQQQQAQAGFQRQLSQTAYQNVNSARP